MVGKIKKKVREITKAPLEDVIRGVGSPASIWVHTVLFLIAFGIGGFGFYSWEIILLVVTTIVSLEAIYLALFIQMSVNRNTDSLREVEEDIDEIEEGLEEIEGDLEELAEEDKAEEKRDQAQSEAIEQLSSEVHRLLELVQQLKKK